MTVGAAFLLATVAAPLQAGFPAEQPAILRLDAGRLLSLARRAEESGDIRTAETAYRALTQDPDLGVRNEARFRLARLRAGKGDRRSAALLLRQILDEQPAAAAARLALAQTLVGIGDEASARQELRALRAGELPLEVERMVRRFSDALRARKPFGVGVELALAPDSNINRATRADTVGTIIGQFEISEDGKPTSGTGLAVRGQAYRRIALGSDVAMLARISAAGDLYRQREYNDLALDAAVGPDLRLGRNHIRMELGAARRWIGGQPFLDAGRIAATVARPIDRRTQLRLAGSASLIDHRFNDLQDGRAYAASIGIDRALSPTTGVAVTIAGERQALRDPGYSTRSWRASLVGWRAIEGITMTGGIEHGRLAADDRLILFPEKRKERFTRLTVGATLRRMTVAGFAPLVRYSIERNRSSIEFYDYSRRRTEIGIARAF